MQNQKEDNQTSDAEEEISSAELTDTKELTGELPSGETTNLKQPLTKRKKLLYGISLFFVLVILGILSGYWKGINDRVNYQELLISTEASEQLVRAIMDMNSENYSQAVSRLEYIINLDPKYPGAVDLLAESLVFLNNPTPTPTITLTPTITTTPTPDNSSKENLYQQALTQNQAEDWDGLISTLDQLRYEDQYYRTNEVNTLYYNGLRNRGVMKILNEGLLESGIYDLNNAENFFPLDMQAINSRQWAEWYVTGASFWDVDWFQTIKYFKYLVPQAPYLMDSSFFAAIDRLATAEVIYPTLAIGRANIYMDSIMYCEASQIFDYLSENYGPLTQEYWEPQLIARHRCADLMGTAQP